MDVSAIDRMQYYFYREDHIVAGPAYEVRVVNNTSESISIDQLVLNVQSSHSYEHPVVIFLTDEWELGYLLFKNESNRPVNKIKL